MFSVMTWNPETSNTSRTVQRPWSLARTHSPDSRPRSPCSGRPLPLAAYHLGSKDLEAVQAEQPVHSGAPGIDPLILQTSDIRKLCEASGAVLALLPDRRQHTAHAS